MTKIALFFGGKISKHLVLVRNAARKMGEQLDLVSYNNVCFETETGKISLRGKDVNDYDVLFFRTTGKHWEEVDLIINSITAPKASHLGGQGPIVVDPLVRFGKPSYACKAWQMLKLKEAGIDVPKSVYGSLWYLYEVMARNYSPEDRVFSTGEAARQAQNQEKILEGEYKFDFPIILKGSGGDRGTRVFKADNLKQLEKLVRKLRISETKEGKRYMIQEYIENGIKRFTSGKYGSRSTVSAMVGYVQFGEISDIVSLLIPLMNTTNLSLDQIVSYQYNVGGVNLHDNKHQFEFLEYFYDYVSKNKSDNYTTPYSEWINQS